MSERSAIRKTPNSAEYEVRTPALGTYVPALDGVRAIAITGVILVHLGYAPGGFAGVQVFFVLSGFLIASLLLDEQARFRTVNLGGFYSRRAARLAPALVASVVVTDLVFAVTGGASVRALTWGTVASLCYFMNFWSCVRNTFAPALNYTWTLAQEEQFYLLAPLAISRLRPGGLRTKHAKARAVLIGVGLLWSLRLILLLAAPGTALSTYHNPLLNMDGLLLGVAIAMALAGRAAINVIVGPAALGAVGLAIIGLSYAGGRLGSWPLAFTVAAAESGAALLILSMTSTTTTMVGRLCASWPMRWVGERSYGIYLYQIAMIRLVFRLAAHATPAVPSFGVAVTAIVATLTVAALSARFIERPVRTYVRQRFSVVVTANGLSNSQPAPAR